MKILFLAPQPFYTERGNPIAVKLAVTALCRDGQQVDLLTYHQGQDIDIPGMRLFRAGKPHSVLPLANFTHMVPEPLVMERQWELIARTFKDTL